MKKLVVIIFVFIYGIAFSQSDSIVVSTSPAAKRPIERCLIINGFIIQDTAKANAFLLNLSYTIKKRKVYSSLQAYKRWGIIARDGVLVCYLRKDIIINIEEMKVIKKRI